MMQTSDPLTDLLHRWQPKPGERPEFTREVQRQIAVEAAGASPARRFRFPALLPLAAALAILIGSISGLGISRAQHQSAMADAYVRSIDPVMMVITSNPQ